MWGCALSCFVFSSGVALECSIKFAVGEVLFTLFDFWRSHVQAILKKPNESLTQNLTINLFKLFHAVWPGILIRNLEQDGFFWDRYHDLTLEGHKKMQLAVMPPQVSGLAATFKAPPPGCAGPPAFPFKSPPTQRPLGLEETQPIQNQTG